MVKADLEASPNAILGGSILRWGENVFPPFDLIVFLWLPPDIRMARIHAREQARYGEKLQNAPAYIQHHQEFIAWAADYDHDTGIAMNFASSHRLAPRSFSSLRSRTLNTHEKWLKDQTAPILQLREDLTVQQRVDRVLAIISKSHPSGWLK